MAQSDDPTPDPAAERPTVHVNLAALQGGFQIRLQHLLDVVAISLLGSERVDETAYKGFSAFWRVFPAQNRQLSSEAAAREARIWYLRTAFRDAVEAANSFLEEVRKVAAIYQIATDGVLTVAQFEAITRTEAKKFHELGLPAKLQRLQDEFSVTTDLGEHVLTINRVRNCLVHRSGIVSEQDVDKAGELTLRWRVLGLFARSPDGDRERPIDPENAVVEAGWSVVLRAVERSRVFKAGARVELTYDEITQTFVTLMQFGMQILQSLEKFMPTVTVQNVAKTRPNYALEPAALPSVD